MHERGWFRMASRPATSLPLPSVGARGSVCIGVVLVLALVVRLLLLSSVPGFSGDEAWYGVQAQKVIGFSVPEMRTLGGNLLNPFFMGPLTIVEALGGPSVITLRSIAVLSGALGIVLALLLFRRSVNSSAAVVLAALVAWTPIDVIYSRISWDPCLTIPAALIVVHLALLGRWLWVAVALAAAASIHSSNLLLYGPVFALLIAHLLDRNPNRWSVQTMLGIGLLIVLPLLVFHFGINPHAVPWRSNPHAVEPSQAAEAAAHLHSILDPRAWVVLVVYYGRLMSGITAYESVAGPVSEQATYIHVVLFWLFAGVVLLFGGLRLWRMGDRRFMALLIGTAASAGGSYVAFAMAPLIAGNERYSLSLVVPILVLLAMCLSAGLPVWQAFLRVTPVLILSGVSLIMNYFDPLLRTGGADEWPLRPWRTAIEEPKMQVATLLAQDRGFATDRGKSCGKSQVIAEDWWIAWPLRYLLPPDAFEVVNLDARLPGRSDIDGALNDGTYVVSWVGGPLENQGAPSVPHEQTIIRDRGGKELLTIWHKPVSRAPSGDNCPPASTRTG